MCVEPYTRRRPQRCPLGIQPPISAAAVLRGLLRAAAGLAGRPVLGALAVLARAAACSPGGRLARAPMLRAGGPGSDARAGWGACGLLGPGGLSSKRTMGHSVVVVMGGCRGLIHATAASAPGIVPRRLLHRRWRNNGRIGRPLDPPDSGPTRRSRHARAVYPGGHGRQHDIQRSVALARGRRAGVGDLGEDCTPACKVALGALLWLSAFAGLVGGGSRAGGPLASFVGGFLTLGRSDVVASSTAVLSPDGGRHGTVAAQTSWRGADVPEDAGAAELRFGLGDLVLAVDADPWRLRLLLPGGETVWEEATDETVGFRTEAGATGRAVRLLTAGSSGDGAVRLVAGTDDPGGRQIDVDVRSVAPRVARLTVAVSPSHGVAAVGGGVVAGEDERFVGFGERFDGVNQRGRIVDIWAEDRVLAGYGASTYAPIPLLLSNRGYGVALERHDRSRFDLAATRADRWSWEQDAATVSLLVSYGPGLRELVERQAEAWGTPPLPPIWAFGVWKTSVGGQHAVLEEAASLRQHGVPISAMFVYDAIDHASNIGWPHVNYAGRRAGAYPDHAGLTAGLRRFGIRALNYFRADFHLDQPGYAGPAGLGLLVRRSDGEPYVHSRFPASWLDFTNPRAVDWWRGAWARALGDLGYDGGMLDVGEILPADAAMWDGSPGVRTHNRYPLLYARSAWEHAASLRPDGDFVLFARSGAQGAHRYQSLQWPGDARMEWEGPGGLQSIVPAALSFGLSGYPYFHAEVAGYVQAGLSHGEERELWLRWLQLATWTATLRDHYGDHPVAPVDAWLDPETLLAFRDAARVHNSLVPYLYTHAREAAGPACR